MLQCLPFIMNFLSCETAATLDALTDPQPVEALLWVI
jgi:hypothetical protein